MGVNVKANGNRVEVGRYRITESSTPLAGGDSSGAVGVIDLDIQQPNTRFLEYGEWHELYRNLATNPSFETTSGTSEVRRNHFPDPHMLLNTTVGWNSAVSSGVLVSNDAVTTPEGNPGRRITITDVGTTGIWALYGGRNSVSSGMPIGVTGDKWLIGMRLSASASTIVSFGLGYGTGSTWWSPVALNVGTSPATHWVEFTVPSAANNAPLNLRIAQTSESIQALGVSGWVELSQPVFTKPWANPSYFDGSSGSSDPDLTTAWLGPVAASSSSLRGVGVTGVAPILNAELAAVTTQSWSSQGTRSVRLIPKGLTPSANSSAVLQIISSAPGNTVYTAKAKIRIENPQTGALDANARTLSLYFGATSITSAPAPNAPGVYELTVTGATPPEGGTFYVTAENGATHDNGDIWVDDLVVIQGNYDGPYFDGNTPINGSATRSYDWVGPENASQSIWEERTITNRLTPMNPFLLSEKQVEFIDTSRGSTLGTIRQIENNRDAEYPWHITANTRLGDFNIEVQSLPVSGTLEAAFEYYCALANIDSDIRVDPSIASMPVNFPGWRGNLWTHMKMMATGISADLNLISNVVVLRPVRQFVALTDRETSATPSLDNTDLALKQEVIWYDTERVASGLIYPPGGWNPEVRVLSVNAGQTVETTLEVPASITSIEQPVAMASVAPDYSATSVYTVVGDDNIVIQPAQWAAYGGSLSVAISDDTRSLVVTMTGASGLVQINGQPMKTFRIALSAGTSDSTYSTLRIVGDSIQLNEQSLIIPTGVEPWRTGQEFAPTIDNPFMNTLDDAYSAGVRGARRHSGKTFGLSATVTAVNRRGERGTANYPPYSYAQALWDSQTYGSVDTINAGMTYAERAAIFYAEVQDDFDNQVFGNVVGARYFDRSSARWYRVRDANTEWGIMNINADDDLLFGDIQDRFDAMTYGQVKTHFSGSSYYEANVRGVS